VAGIHRLEAAEPQSASDAIAGPIAQSLLTGSATCVARRSSLHRPKANHRPAYGSLRISGGIWYPRQQSVTASPNRDLPVIGMTARSDVLTATSFVRCAVAGWLGLPPSRSARR
jgi:hypothetical protein